MTASAWTFNQGAKNRCVMYDLHVNIEALSVFTLLSTIMIWTQGLNVVHKH